MGKGCSSKSKENRLKCVQGDHSQSPTHDKANILKTPAIDSLHDIVGQ